jgi:hypothetical protein
MANVHFIGGTSQDASTAANWSGAAVPGDGDKVSFDDRARQGCTQNCDSAFPTHTFARVNVTKGYTYPLAASGAPFAPAAITELLFNSGHAGQSYFGCALADATIDAHNTANEVELSGELAELAIRRGHVKLVSGMTIDTGGAHIVMDKEARLTIDASLTLTGTEIHMSGGELVTLSNPDVLHVSGGTARLRGAAACSGLIIVAKDGILYWDSTGTLAKVYLEDQAQLLATEYNLERTLTECHTHGNAQIDLRNGGNMITVSALWVHGNRGPLFSPGTKLAVA